MPANIVFTLAAPLGFFDRLLPSLGAFIAGNSGDGPRRDALEPFGI